MKAALDASSAAKPGGSGIQVYIRSLVGALAALPGDHEFTLCYRASRFKNRNYFLPLPDKRFKEKIIQEPFNPLFGRSVDVFHGPDARLPGYERPALVATIHDLFSLVSDDFADEKFRTKKRKRYADLAARADVIIVPSESTAIDVKKHLSVVPERLKIVPHGVGEAFRPQGEDEIERVRAKLGIRKDEYVLYVGNVSARKNTARLVRAFRAAIASIEEPPVLVIAGSDGYGSEETDREIEASPPGAVIKTGYVDDLDLPALYSGAAVFAFPSLYEGFGIPVLEAFACETPVVCSTAASLPEVAGDAAFMVDPSDENALGRGILDALEGGERVAALVEKGKKRVDAFTWKSCAEKTLAAYEYALNRKATKGLK